MTCALDKDLIEETILFHGHNCPGLSIGIRVSELAMERLDIQSAATPVCVTETDMCGVDAIQFLTGCTFGKGNLIHRDYGKKAFTFYDREARSGFRALFRDNFTGAKETDADSSAARRINQIMSATLSDLFTCEPIDAAPAKLPRIMKSEACDACGEMTMETRIRLLDGKKMCLPCFQKLT